MLSSFAEINYYLRQLAAAHPELQDVVIGDSEQILSVDRSRLSYPCLWVETPTLSWRLGDNPKSEFVFYFLVLVNTTTDDFLAQELIMDRTLHITEDIIGAIYQDSDEGNLNIISPLISSEPVLGYGHDHDFGWRTKITIERLVRLCPRSCQDFDHIAELPKFSYANNVAGDFSDLQLTEMSTLSGEISRQWRYQINAEPMVSSSSPPAGDLGAGDRINIILSITTDRGTFSASARFSNARQCGHSVPFVIKQLS